MRRRGRVWRVGKWGGLALTAIVATLWLGSRWWWLRVETSRLPPRWVEIRRGEVAYTHDTPLFIVIDASRPYSFLRRNQFPGFEWKPAWDVLGTRTGTIHVPLWVLLLAIASPTAFLWYCARRPPPGHCQRCGYDLTGNVSGRCSECGAPT